MDETALPVVQATSSDIFIAPDHLLLPRGCRLLRAGMVNEDNVCYANSLLACLACAACSIPHILLQLPLALQDAVRKLLSVYESSAPSIQMSPSHLVRDHPVLFQNWPVGAHEDAFEFLQHILGDSHIPCLSHMVQVTRWHVSGRVMTELQTQQVLTFSLQTKDERAAYDQLSLTSLFETWGAPSQEEGDWYQSQSSLIAGPELLVLHLQRFAVIAGRITKLCMAVVYDDLVTIPMTSGDRVSFRLQGVLAHHGQEPNVGHYSAYVRASDAGFVRCNDLSLSSSGLSVEALSHASARDAYMFFLQRI